MLTISKDDNGTVSIANNGLATKQELAGLATKVDNANMELAGLATEVDNANMEVSEARGGLRRYRIVLIHLIQKFQT